MNRSSYLLAMAMLLLCGATPALAERVKDICDVKGVRGNPLMGYGLVIGLDGTGDDSAASRQAMTSYLRRNAGMNLTPQDLASKSIASVIVSAELPPFGRAGARVDVTVSAIGNTTSLQGGTLLMTPLFGADGQVYAVASGELSVGGIAAAGQAASVTRNHPTVGRIPNGATIEKEELATFVHNGRITLQLRNPDFTTAGAIAQAVNNIDAGQAVATDAGTVEIALPLGLDPGQVTALLDRVLSLDVPVDQPAVVIINERTGTIIVGANVGISMVAISHGNLTITTSERDYVSQPNPFSTVGETERMHRTDLSVTEEVGPLHVIERQVSVAELARALNAMGLSPRDLISIFQALKQAGALQADLRIM